MSLSEILSSFGTAALSIVLRILGIILVLIIGLRLARWCANKFKNAKANANLDPTVKNVLSNLILWAVRVVMIVMICGLLNIPTASVIAVLGSIGLAIGLAVQGGLANIAGGIMIIMFRPFKIGDCVCTSGYTGFITDISLFYTTLTTLDNVAVVLPNGSLMGASVVNYSREEKRRVDLNFTVGAGTDIDAVRKILLACAVKDEKVLKDPAPVVLYAEQAASGMTFQVRAWCNGNDYWDVFFGLQEEVRRAFTQFNIEVPYQTVNVNVIDKK